MNELLSNPLGLNSVRVRLILLNFGVLALVLMTLGFALSVSARISLERQADDNLKIYAGQLSQRAEKIISAKLRLASPRTLSSALVMDRPRYYPPIVLDLAGARLVPSVSEVAPAGNQSGDAPFSQQGLTEASQGRSGYTGSTFRGDRVRIYSTPLRVNGKIVGVLELARSQSDVYDEYDRVNNRLLALIPLAILAAGLGGAFLTTRALSPVRKIAQAASRIEAEHLSGRLPVVGNDEFAELAMTINGMLSRLEDSFNKLERAYDLQRRFAADASHELRTPLTVIKANASLELIEAGSAERLQGAIEAIDRAADRTNRIVEDLLLLARSEAGELKPSHYPISLDSAIFQALDLIQSGGPRIVVDSEEGLGDGRFNVVGDQDAIIRLFTNLLNNAVQHTPETGTITISARQAGDSAIVRISDTGEGIAPQHIPHLTERFYRVDKARTRKAGGTGLGLSICKSIVEAHNGSMLIESELGRGTSVTVLLPTAFDIVELPQLPTSDRDRALTRDV